MPWVLDFQGGGSCKRNIKTCNCQEYPLTILHESQIPDKSNPLMFEPVAL